MRGAQVLRVWDAFALEGVKVLHRVALALLKVLPPPLPGSSRRLRPRGVPQVAEARLLACADEQAMLCTLQEEQARCFDSDRLFSLAFDVQGVADRFSRAQLVALRTKHRQLLLAQEPGAPQQSPRAVAAPSGAPAEADSSDEEEQGPASEDADGEKFEMLSHDDVAKERSRRQGQQSRGAQLAGRGSFFGASIALPSALPNLPKVSLSFARGMFE